MPAETGAPAVPRPFRVAERVVETADTVTFGFEPVDGEQIDFRPGQFNMLCAFGVGDVPISMSGTHDRLLLHTVRSVGAVTRAICSAEAGDVLGVRGPYGSNWGLEGATGRDVVLLAGGIGLAPLRPAIEHVLARREQYGRVSVLVGARSPDLLLFKDDVTAWRTGLDAQVETTVDVATTEWRGDVGLVTELISRAPFDPLNTLALVCGPEIMMRGVAATLVDRGVPPNDIRISMERNMKCAIGHCGHCQFGPHFVCKDGPVFPYQRVAPLIGLREV